MSRFVLCTIILSFAMVISGCQATYKNISTHPDFTRYIGKTYALKNEMSIRGINLPPGYDSKIDTYVVSELYKIHHKAPEEVTFAALPKGSTFTIIEIRECTNCLFFKKLRKAYIITDDFDKSVDAPIVIPMHEIESQKNVTPIQ